MKKAVSWADLVKKSVLASVLIGLGDFVLLKAGAPIGAFLFSLGLFGVCMLKANLFTGKCGFVFADKKWRELLVILGVNLVAGWAIGWLFGIADPSIVAAAQEKALGWSCTPEFFLRSVFCGAIMYIAVKCYKKKSVWGIFLGVPLFILAGFQHSIANIITAGVAVTFTRAIFLCVVGNFVGSVALAWLAGEYKK